MKYYITGFFVIFSSLLNAQLKVASVLGDDMVLQRNANARLWGKAKPSEKLIITTSWNNAKVNTTANDKGEWLAKVITTDAGGPYTITIASLKEKLVLKNVLLGEVWLCSGQSNMDMPIDGYKDQPIIGSNDILVDAENNNIRLFTGKPTGSKTLQDTIKGNWSIASAESVAKFSAVGYLYAKQLQQRLKVPVGMICLAYGGARIESWMSKETIANFPEALSQTSDEKLKPQYKASYLYNAMLHPILNYTIKGAIWYQGEANVPNNKGYANLMAAMVDNWRKDFGIGDFPFYYVQLAPYFYDNSKATPSALLRDEQLKAQLIIPNSGMACTIDLGEEKVIHIPDKYTVAKRLAYWAFAETYNIKGINHLSPTYKNMVVKDSVAIVYFNNLVNGLNSFGKEVESFEIAGEDKIFYPAKIKTNRQDQVIVYSPNVKVPVAVRYGFCNFPITKGFLYNTAGLPVPSFRTDDW